MTNSMKLAEFKKKFNIPLREVSLCFLVKDDQILLALKKRGFGQGTWNGVGGKTEKGESVDDSAIRETKEEIGVDIKKMEKVCVFNFYFPYEPIEKDWNQQVHIYLVSDWEGEPSESEEVAPKWFSKEALPYDSMWPDDRFWWPEVLKGKKLKGYFAFAKNGEIEEHNMESCDRFD